MSCIFTAFDFDEVARHFYALLLNWSVSFTSCIFSRPEKHPKASPDRQIIALFMKSGSLYLMAMEELQPNIRK